MKNPIETLPKELIQHAHLFRVFKPPQSSQPINLKDRIPLVERPPHSNLAQKRRYDSSTSLNLEKCELASPTCATSTRPYFSPFSRKNSLSMKATWSDEMEIYVLSCGRGKPMRTAVSEFL